MSAPHLSPTHLLPADDSLDALRREGTYMALCGALLPAGSLPPWECPPGCDCAGWMYCLDCIQVAAEHSGLTESAGLLQLGQRGEQEAQAGQAERAGGAR